MLTFLRADDRDLTDVERISRDQGTSSETEQGSQMRSETAFLTFLLHQREIETTNDGWIFAYTHESSLHGYRLENCTTTSGIRP